MFDKRTTKEGSVEFSDGEYTVIRTFENGMLKEQAYIYDGRRTLTVRITGRQISGGFSFPKSVSLDAHDGNPPSEFQMGESEINPISIPIVTPPKGKEASRLERVR